MKKVFLYLYPIKEFTSMFLFHNDSLYDELNIERPLPILNEAIDRRYRRKGYQIVFALYPDRELYGIEQEDEDKIIYADIPFSEVNPYDERGNAKENFIPKYPSEDKLIEELGAVDELVVSGYHASDCVKKVAYKAYQRGINTSVDLDLTELFFGLYKQKDYFDLENYNPERFKSYMIAKFGVESFDRDYATLIYDFIKQSDKQI